MTLGREKKEERRKKREEEGRKKKKTGPISFRGLLSSFFFPG
jgi:hypothetical protein